MRINRCGVLTLAIVAALVLAACGGDDGGNADSGDNGASADTGGGEAAGLSIGNLDQELVLDNSGTLAEDTPFENFVINYPSNWHANQDGFEMTVSNNSDVVSRKGPILAGMQEIPEGAVLINALSQASLAYGGYPVGDAANAEELLSGYLMAFGQTGEAVPYEELDIPAYRYVSVDGVEQFFPAGTVLVAVEYDSAMALYQVVFDGPIEEFEPSVREIIANASIDG
jgi:hypothetical protein